MLAALDRRPALRLRRRRLAIGLAEPGAGDGEKKSSGSSMRSQVTSSKLPQMLLNTHV